MAVSRLGIVGSGQMGGGVAEVAGQAGLEVLIHDMSEDLCRRDDVLGGRAVGDHR